jgi:AcrR family transcriptional regulator
MSPKVTRNGEATYAKLIDASYKLFVTQGYHGTSMRAIAEQAGITAGSIYNHFADKEQIFNAVLATYHPVARVFPHLHDAQGQTVEALLHDAALRLVGEINTNPGLLGLLSIEIVEFNARHISQVTAELLPLVEDFIQKLYGAEGELRPIPPLVLFTSFIGIVVAYTLARMTPAAEQISLDDFLEVFLRGVLA